MGNTSKVIDDCVKDWRVFLRAVCKNWAAQEMPSLPLSLHAKLDFSGTVPPQQPKPGVGYVLLADAIRVTLQPDGTVSDELHKESWAELRASLGSCWAVMRERGLFLEHINMTFYNLELEGKMCRAYVWQAVAPMTDEYTFWYEHGGKAIQDEEEAYSSEMEGEYSGVEDGDE